MQCIVVFPSAYCQIYGLIRFQGYFGHSVKVLTKIFEIVPCGKNLNVIKTLIKTKYKHGQMHYNL